MTETKWGKALTGPEMKALGLPVGTEFGWFRPSWGDWKVDRVRDNDDFRFPDNFCLPPDHPAYTVHEINKQTGSRFKFHAGGPKPDGEIARVLFRGGQSVRYRSHYYWDWREHKSCDIIGYELAEVAAEVVEPKIGDGQLPPGPDTVTIKRMTEAERTRLYPHLDLNTLKDLRLIREETREEQFTRETGFPVTDAVAAALEWGR